MRRVEEGVVPVPGEGSVCGDVFELDADFVSHHIEGITVHGDLDFSAPLISHIDGNLWVGGCRDFVRLPDEFVDVVSMYPWERYWLGPDTVRREFGMEDGDEVDVDTALAAAAHARACLDEGPTLIHCQAGLNRSGLVATLVLMGSGWRAQNAIGLLRERRSHAVLCNPTFERWLLRLDEAVPDCSGRDR